MAAEKTGKGRVSNKRNNPHRFEMDQRRGKVAELYVRGHSINAIAEAVGVSKHTVIRDMREVRAQWREQYADTFQRYTLEQIRKIDAVEQEAWEAWQASKQDAVTISRKEPSDGDIETTTTVKGQTGDPRYLEAILRAIERRSKLLGLDAPEKVQWLIKDEQAGDDEDGDSAELAKVQAQLVGMLDTLRERARTAADQGQSNGHGPAIGLNGHTET